MNLLLLRGLARDQRSWGDFPSRFEAHAPRMKLHFMDLPGVGTENQRPSPTSIPAIRIELAKRFHEQVARGKLPAGPWSLLAISMGGMVALDWASAEPELFQKLILVNTSSADVSSPFERFQWRRIPGMALSLIVNRPDFSERTILSSISNRFVRTPGNQDPKLQAVFENQVRWRRERPVTRTTFVRQLLAAANYRLPAERPRPKTVLISSEGDRVVHSRCSVHLAERLDAPRLSHPWAGHDIAIDDPEWLAREVVEWMDVRP